MGFFNIFDQSDKPDPKPAEAQLRAIVHGRVQGVGFRWWTMGQAKPLGLVGYAKNLDDGTVEVLAQGRRATCQQLLEILQSGDTAGHVVSVDAEIGDPTGSYKSFGVY